MKRYDFVPFKDGKVVDLGGYVESDSLRYATQQATVLGMYGYDSISIECEGVIVDVVKFAKTPRYR